MELKEREGEEKRGWRRWGGKKRTLGAEEKVESMKLVVLAARSIRSAPGGLSFYSIIMQMPE